MPFLIKPGLTGQTTQAEESRYWLPVAETNSNVLVSSSWRKTGWAGQVVPQVHHLLLTMHFHQNLDLALAQRELKHRASTCPPVGVYAAPASAISLAWD